MEKILKYLSSLCISTLLFVIIVITLPFYSVGIIPLEVEAEIVFFMLLAFIIYQLLPKKPVHR